MSVSVLIMSRTVLGFPNDVISVVGVAIATFFLAWIVVAVATAGGTVGF